ncbi:MAG: hypothetical protein RLZZ175_127 [Bacteroidota bacterium]|jgi:uncharacterized protein (DUF58 family)
MQEIFQRIKKIEVKIRTAVDTNMHGDFKSVFKGTGLEFDEVRTYQYGDDIRTIDWNVTAKGHGTFVKTFHEDREQSVYFIIDVSASQNVGKNGAQKIDLAREICAVLALSANKEESQISLIAFSDQKEKYVKPGKGLKHVYWLVNELYTLQPKSTNTSLSDALSFSAGIIKKKSVIILISDFIDENYENGLRALARKHSLVVIHLADKSEQKIPSLGIVPVYDPELKKTIWTNTSSFSFRKKINAKFADTKSKLELLCKQNKAKFASFSTQEDYVPTLIKLFKIRKNN